MDPRTCFSECLDAFRILEKVSPHNISYQPLDYSIEDI